MGITVRTSRDISCVDLPTRWPIAMLDTRIHAGSGLVARLARCAPSKLQVDLRTGDDVYHQYGKP